MYTVTVTVAPGQGELLVPKGMATPHLGVDGFDVDGGNKREVTEQATGQVACLIKPAGDGPITLTYHFGAERTAAYPDEMFQPIDSRFTRAADDLVQSAQGFDDVSAIIAHIAGMFDYSHPDVRFYDNTDHVPHLCSTTVGSCVDINLYLIAMLRSAGFEAGYMTGYFFPSEKRGSCDDMHCWVVTRHGKAVQDWDIAHHLKMGTKDICPGLNPKPGHRVPLAHSMGLSFPDLGLSELKLLSEPVWLTDNGPVRANIGIRSVRS